MRPGRQTPEAPWGGWVAVLALAYAVVMSAACVYRFSLIDFAYDLHIFDQAFWSTIHEGTLLGNSQEGIEFGRHSHFSLHFSPALLALVPFYALWPAPQTLLILKTLALALAAFPVFAFAARRLGSRPMGAAVAALFLLYPPLHGVNVWGFHENEFAVAPLAFAIWFLETRRRRAFWIAVVVALCAKETVALTLAAFGVYLAIFRRGERATGAALLAVCVVWILAAEFVVMPLFRGKAPLQAENLYFVQRYDPSIGRSYGEILGNCLRHPLKMAAYALGHPVKQAYLFHLLFPFAFLVLLAPETLLIAAPVLAINLLSAYKGQVIIFGQYHAEIIPFLFYGFCLGVDRLARWIGPGQGGAGLPTGAAPSQPSEAGLIAPDRATMRRPAGRPALQRAFIAVALATTVTANVFFGAWAFAFGRENQLLAITMAPERRTDARALMARIPSDTSVLAGWNFANYLSQRRWIHTIQSRALGAHPWEYVIYDTRFPWATDITMAEFENFLAEAKYEQIEERAGMRLYRRPAANGGGADGDESDESP